MSRFRDLALSVQGFEVLENLDYRCVGCAGFRVDMLKGFRDSNSVGVNPKP